MFIIIVCGYNIVGIYQILFYCSYFYFSTIIILYKFDIIYNNQGPDIGALINQQKFAKKCIYNIKKRKKLPKTEKNVKMQNKNDLYRFETHFKLEKHRVSYSKKICKIHQHPGPSNN